MLNRAALPKLHWPAALDLAPGRMPFDAMLALCAIALVLTSFVMIASASMDVAARDFGSPTFFILRQSIYIGLSLVVVAFVSIIPVWVWHRHGATLLVLGFVLLVLVLIPGIGREVNGSKRWIGLGFFNLQASEVAKMCMVLFMSGYLVRRLSEVRSGWWGVVKPIIPLAFYVALLILEPDFGATVILMGTVMGMIFLGGMRFGQFLVVVVGAAFLAYVMAIFQPYRMQRLTSFQDPWADPFGTGYQLSQAQIAFGRGEWFGTGLGNSVQKLFYLPEAHTDFIYSVLSEEFGLIGALVIVVLYILLVSRLFLIGRRAEKLHQFFMAYTCYGFGFIFAGQALINIGVNVGALPTKGLTLPLFSYGGSSLLVSAAMITLVLRIDYELKKLQYSKQEKGRNTVPRRARHG
ncbi:putative lipid II flippase FtsW [Nitrincola sp. MINF-07-Sa-05]|uniref:putative lipid II flippase FtsW n=1 Tax=Nitrincola salilacus TaxID=3400273 RepID=UPI0039183D18